MSDTPETDAQLTTYDSISKLGKHFANKRGTVSAEFARKLERERDNMREFLKSFVECVDAAINSGDWKVDGACDPDSILQHARRILK